MQKSHEVRSTGEQIARVIIWILMALLAVIVIFPVLYIVFGSFKENAELLKGGYNIFPVTWIV